MSIVGEGRAKINELFLGVLTNPKQGRPVCPRAGNNNRGETAKCHSSTQFTTSPSVRLFNVEIKQVEEQANEWTISSWDEQTR